MDLDGWLADEDDEAAVAVADEPDNDDNAGGGCDDAGDARATREGPPPPPPLALMPPWEAGRPAAEVGVWFEAEDAILARVGSGPRGACCDDNGEKGVVTADEE